MFYEVIPTKIFRNSSGALTYYSDLALKSGHIVTIPLGKTSCVGIVLKKVPEPSFKCKPITKLLYETPLPSHLLKSALWLSSYYLSPLPSCASLLLPIGVEKHRKKATSCSATCPIAFRREEDVPTAASCSVICPNPQMPAVRNTTITKRVRGDVVDERRTDCCISDDCAARTRTKTEREVALNGYQRKALQEIKSIQNPTKLLFGITGSGKTNIYLKLTAETLKKGQSVILLVPEIALTSQLVQIFKSTFENQITLLHSKQTEAERHLAWETILNSAQPQIIIGPRSALFAPLKNLGLIIIDEAHETAYFQENAPKYSSLRLASFIASTLKIPCLLGTATPLVADFYLAKEKASLVSLTEKAKSTAIAPTIKVIDFKTHENFTKNRYFSDALLAAIQQNLKENHQTLIYHNRRGSAPMTICEHCGWQALCPQCFLPLILHADSYQLICHTCGHQETIPTSCPDCHHPSILHKGFGTKLLETELKKLFPNVAIARFDADNKKDDSLDALYNEVKTGQIKILIGTQTVSRGLDLPHLATIGIVQADAGLSLPDFSAEEKTFELLTQVIGRVGRGHLSTASVFIQTYQPDSPVINFALHSDYLGFYDYLIKKRRQQHLPPFSYLAKIVVTYKTEQTTVKKIRTLSKSLNNFIAQNHLQGKLHISPPTPCFHERTPSGFSWQLTVKSTSRNHLLKLLNNVDAKITLDPPSLL